MFPLFPPSYALGTRQHYDKTKVFETFKKKSMLKKQRLNAQLLFASSVKLELLKEIFLSEAIC